MRHYCTLFDSKYLPQGLALYDSLRKHSSEAFTLYVLAMDSECYRTLETLALPNMKLTALDEFESLMYLGKIRRERTWAEFCWSLASIFTDYLLRSSGLIEVTHAGSRQREFIDGAVSYIDEITYLDADVWFTADPQIIFDEIGYRSIAVITHRLIPSKKHLEINGKYNVSWVTFKNTPAGRECLATWAGQCRERCSAIVGCGDQKYLDEFDKYGKHLCVIQNIGVGVAPWNLANYEVTQGLDFFFQFRPYVDGNLVVFYHYHEFRKNDDGTFRLTNYELRDDDRKYIYEPYLAAYKRAEQLIASTISVQA